MLGTPNVSTELGRQGGGNDSLACSALKEKRAILRELASDGEK